MFSGNRLHTRESTGSEFRTEHQCRYIKLTILLLIMLSILNFQILVRQAPRRDDPGIDTGNAWLIGIFLNASVQRTSAEVMSAWPV